ncbi:MAG: cyclic nucleotide-binding domain-containing protein, partial [Mesorhizobium sp.]
MTDQEVAPEALPLFRALPASKRTELLRNAMVHSVPSGTVLFDQGEVPNFQLIVLAGSAQLFGRSVQGREVLIEGVRAPDLVIPAAVLTGAPYLMQARVPEPSRFLLIHAAAFRAAVEAEPLLAHAAIGSLAAQFRRMVLTGAPYLMQARVPEPSR